MSKSRRRRKSSSSKSFSVRKKRSGVRTFIETIMGVSIGLMILAFVGWWYFLREAPEPISVAQVNNAAIKDNVVDDAASYESVRDNGTLDEQRHLLSQLDNWPRDATTPVRIETLSRRLEIAQTILKRDDITDQDRIATAKIELNAIGQIYGICLVENVDSDGTVYRQYLEICEKHSRDADAGVRKEAAISETKAIVYESTKNSQIANFDQIKSSITSIIADYPADPLVASTVSLMFKRVKAIDPQKGFEVMKLIAAAYGPTPTEEVAAITRGLNDEILVIESGISQLAKQAAQTKQYDDYLEKLGELADVKNTGIDIVNRIYRAVSYFEATDQNEYAERVLKQLQKNAADRTDPVARIQALRVCKFGLIRNNQLGKVMDMSDTDSNGNPIATDKFKNVPTLLVYYSLNDPKNASLFQQLRELHTLVAPTGVRIVTISVDESTNNALDFGFNPAWDNIASTPNAPSEIFSRCPVTHIPYFALIDKKGKLAALNVPPQNLKTRIEFLASAPSDSSGKANSEVKSDTKFLPASTEKKESGL